MFLRSVPPASGTNYSNTVVFSRYAHNSEVPYKSMRILSKKRETND